MVARPPIETWSRPELEDQYHNTVEQLRDTQKKHQELSKKIQKLNSRFRRQLLDRKAKEDGVVEMDKYEELQKENQLLIMKLKTAKHQLLTYTSPSARPQTASFITGRSTYRPISTVRPRPHTAHQPKTERPESIAETRTVAVRVASESQVHEKMQIIKLNRNLREKNNQVAELEYRIDQLTEELQHLRSELERSRSVAQVSERSDAFEKEEKREQIEILQTELQITKNELHVLKKANERLVSQSLSLELSSGVSENTELRMTIAQLEEKLKDSERREKDTEQRRKDERRHNEELRQRERNQMRSNNAGLPPAPPKHSSPQSDISDESPKKRKKKGKESDILTNLYRDVVGVLESFDVKEMSDILEEGGGHNQIALWQRRYGDLYNEMEKVRNMLLSQHNINKKQTDEIALLDAECERLKNTFHGKLEKMKNKLQDKQNKITILEEQIRSIAYSGQKPIMQIGDKADDTSLRTELSLSMRSIDISPEMATVLHSFFLSIEFYDFEIQTTPILPYKKQKIEFTTIYNIVVSSLFMHYLTSNGVSIELYRPKGGSFELIAAGVVSLTTFIKKEKGRFGGVLKLMNVSTGQSVMSIEYELTASQQLTSAFSAYKRMETAQKLIPVILPPEEDQFELLTVNVNRCTGLDKIKQGELEVCIVYELLAFSPFYTNSVITSSIAEFNNRKEWSIPKSAELQNYLSESEISFFLLDSSSSDGVLAMISLPLAPLTEGKAVKGTFPLLTASGEESGAHLDVSVMWKYGYTPQRSLPFAVEPPKPVIREEHSRVPPQSSLDVQSSKQPLVISSTSSSNSEDQLLQPSKAVLERISSSSSTSSNSPPPEAHPESPKAEELKQRMPERQPSIVRDEVRKGGTPSRAEPELDSIIQRRLSLDRPHLSPPPIQMDEEEILSERGSTSSGGTYTKDEPDVPTDDQVFIEAEEVVRKKERDEIRSLLGDLPPIPKPRHSKSESPTDPLAFLDKRIQEMDLDPTVEEEQQEEIPEQELRGIHFSSPLHRSIPPSDTSSVTSPTGSYRKEKEPVRLPRDGGRSAIKPRRPPFKFDDEDEFGAVVSIHIDRLYNLPRFSPILQRRFDGIKFYIDWTFLDYPQEECRVKEAFTLPRTADPEIRFKFSKEYRLSRRRIALLEQYVETQNRLEFSLLTDNGTESEELAVGLLELSRTPNNDTLTLALLDVNGQRYGDLDISLYYPETIFNVLNETRI